ncbi:hypothetical protein [Spirillospora sp. CA-128828]|uniref:hypothetical protein n=1 Tax=Spirillospora sp. CA-128828 TaxID=3240033 RepID=UPI003D8E18A5
MTGRHREQSSDRVAEDEVDEGTSRGKRIAVVAVAFAVPVLLASVIAVGLREEPAQERPETAGTPQRIVTPEGEPTFGRYVPPETQPQAATKAPDRPPRPAVTPRRTTPAPSPSPSARVRRPCPAGWDDVWWMRQWCEGQRHRGR